MVLCSNSRATEMGEQMRSNRLDRIEARMAQLAARKAATLRRLQRDEAKLTNRRKYLLGAYILSTANGALDGLSDDFRNGLDKWATRPRDRETLALSSKSSS